MQDGLSLTFERGLYQAVVRFKAEHQVELDERTRLRKEREKETKADVSQVHRRQLQDI